MRYCPFDVAPDPEPFGLTTRHVDTHYGPLAVRASPRRESDTATLYIHGVGADWTTWTPIILAEARRGMPVHDQLFVNLPGFGDSPNELDRIEIADIGATFLAVVAELGYSMVRIVGHSMGGFLTLDMAGRYPERIASIHLVAGSYFSILRSIQHPVLSFASSPRVAATFGLQYLLAHTGSFEVAMLRALYRIGVFRFLTSPFAAHPLRLRESVVRALCEQTNPRGLVLTAANGHGYDADAQWAKVRCPIWAVFGARDRVVPLPDMAELLRCQPTADTRVIADAGHLLHIERPCEVLDALHLWPAPPANRRREDADES
jgi:pimeloyl-ACP methyl ester carboxylesterase